MPVSVGTEFWLGNEHSPAQRQALLQLARASIAYGLRQQDTPPLPAVLPDWLQVPTATFVTLTLRRRQEPYAGEEHAGEQDAGEQNEPLRGCIGSLQAYRSLAEDVCENAYAAAFRDPRFLPVDVAELGQLRIELSLLSPLQLLPRVQSDAALLAQLRPGCDGLVLVQHGQRATFLPKVWSHFAEPLAFLQALRQKAGLPAEFDRDAQYSVYQVEVFSES